LLEEFVVAFGPGAAALHVKQVAKCGPSSTADAVAVQALILRASAVSGR
jgi:hypothetical protein